MPLLLPSNALVCLRSTSNRCFWLSGVSRPLQDLDLVWLTLFGALNLMTPLPYFPHPSALLRTEPHVALSNSTPPLRHCLRFIHRNWSWIYGDNWGGGTTILPRLGWNDDNQLWCMLEDDSMDRSRCRPWIMSRDV
ncbi:hypothetical protein B0H13DRAFT_2292599 [Mycena leptocephala]|nr:hypothetical protein B0H13DRAFT_2292599 [Mycena leptocephala]